MTFWHAKIGGITGFPDIAKNRAHAKKSPSAIGLIGI
jgi:hypothetical protein